MAETKTATRRLPLLALAFICLILGTWAGLFRIGFRLPMPRRDLDLVHGPLMVSGFLATLIALERAVALRSAWAYLGPIASGIGGVALIVGAPLRFAAGSIAFGALVLLAASIAIVAKHRALHTFTLAVAAASLLLGDVLWFFDRTIPEVVLTWILFVVLTIAGERLELGRVLAPSRASRVLFALVLAISVAGAAIALLLPEKDHGTRVVGGSLVLLVAWLLRYDIVRRTVKTTGLTRYVAVCLLAGYAWLALAGALLLRHGRLVGGLPIYDATLHAIFLGFAFSMIFGHAPIIFPAVTRMAVPYHRSFYLHLIVLHVALVSRVEGDLRLRTHGRSIGSLLNAIAIALFLLATVAAVLRGRRKAT